jgi:hypothetical protein
MYPSDEYGVTTDPAPTGDYWCLGCARPFADLAMLKNHPPCNEWAGVVATSAADTTSG